MKTQFIIIIAAFTLIAAAEKPKSPSAIKAQRSYEDRVQAADKEHSKALTTAKDVYLKELKEALDAALEEKDLKEANVINAALEAIAEGKAVIAPASKLAVKAQRSNEDSVKAANEQHVAALMKAEEEYFKEMQVGLDEAIAAKDLAEANRIDAAIKEMRRKGAATDSVANSTVTNSIGMTFVLIPAGEFMMGSRPSERGRRADEKLHNVTLTQSFQMGIYEVTQAQYEHVVGRNPSRFKGAENPVERVSWVDAVEFCRLLSALPAEQAAGRIYRLPTEAEWEYASRAGASTAYSFGNATRKLGESAWFDQNSNKTTHPVGQKEPNAWGLYDIHGNVMEYCRDFYDSYHDGESPSVDPLGPFSGTSVVSRGGCWFRNALEARSALRGYTVATDNRHDFIGFRVVLNSAGR